MRCCIIQLERSGQPKCTKARRYEKCKCHYHSYQVLPMLSDIPDFDIVEKVKNIMEALDEESCEEIVLNSP